MIDARSLYQNDSSQIQLSTSVPSTEIFSSLSYTNEEPRLKNRQPPPNSTSEGITNKEKQETKKEESLDTTSKDESVAGREFWSSLSSPGGSNSLINSQLKQTGNAKFLVEQIRAKTFQKYNSLREAFLKFDSDKSGYISREEFRTTMAELGLPMTDRDFDIVDSSYLHKEAESDLDKGIGYLEFINILTDELKYEPGIGESESDHNYFGNTTANSTSLSFPGPLISKTPAPVSMSFPFSPSSKSRAPSRGGTGTGTYESVGSNQSEHLVTIQNEFGKKVFSKFRNLKEAFKVADTDGSGFIDLNEFDSLLYDQLQMRLTEEQLFGIMNLFDTNGDGKLSYPEFIKCLHTY